MVKGVFFKVDTTRHLKKSSMKNGVEKKHFVRSNKKPNPTKLRKSIAPGQVLILLAGRFKGRRVVFLKQLENGLLLVTGPFKVNGVPLKRVSQAYVMATSTKLDISKVDVSKVNTAFFAKRAVKFNKEDPFNKNVELTEEDKKNIESKKQVQSTVDKALVEVLKKDKILLKYIGSRFTLRNNQYPHEMKF